jgi:hypothetical protein|tara:strand:+ start:310 stop:513 length:204 start_codon:yes stop_codon:yes gene_type:complete
MHQNADILGIAELLIAGYDGIAPMEATIFTYHLSPRGDTAWHETCMPTDLLAKDVLPKEKPFGGVLC